MILREGEMLQAGKYLLSCLMGAVSRGMKAVYGQDWFEVFKAREKKEKKPILTDEEGIDDFDLQAYLKLFKFRSEYRDAVLSHFGLYDLGTDAGKKELRNTFTGAVTRLMDNYRNKYMHLSAGEADEEWSTTVGDTSYGVAEAISDMKAVSKFFLTVRDPSGVPYYDRICECEARYKASKDMQMYSVAGMLAGKSFKGCSGDDFVRACNELNIPVEKNEDGEFFFYSSDIESDLYDLKRQISRNRERGASRRIKIALIAGLSVAAGAVAAGILIFTFAGRAYEQPVTGISAEEFRAPLSQEGGISREEAGEFLLSLKESAVSQTLEEYKQNYTKKYREDPQLASFIENEQKWLKGAGATKKIIFIPLVSAEDMIGGSAVFYGTLTDAQYKKSRLFSLVKDSEDGGRLKAALERIPEVSKFTGAFPEGYNYAVAEGRNTYINDEADFSFADSSAVIPGEEKAEAHLAWAESDGSVSLLVRIANGTEKAADYSTIHVNVKAGYTLLYDGDADLRQGGAPYRLESGKGASFIINIKKGSLSEGAAGSDWSGLEVGIKA